MRVLLQNKDASSSVSSRDDVFSSTVTEEDASSFVALSFASSFSESENDAWDEDATEKDVSLQKEMSFWKDISF